MQDNKKNKKIVYFYKKHKILFNVICIFIIIAVLSIVVPFVINVTAIESNFPSKAGNDGWISFWGSYIGGIFGGAGTLIALYISSNQARKHQIENMKLTIKIQNENMKLTKEIQDENMKLTRKIQDENREDIERQINLEKNFKQIEYLKDLYRYSYKYEKYLDERLECILNEIYYLKCEYNEEKADKEKIGMIIKEKSNDVIYSLGKLSRDIKIQSASVCSKEIKGIIKSITDFDEVILEKVGKVIIEDYSEDEISKMFSDEEGTFNLVILSLIALNIKIYSEIEKNIL